MSTARNLVGFGLLVAVAMVLAAGFRGGASSAAEARLPDAVVHVGGEKCGVATHGAGALVSPGRVLSSAHVVFGMAEVHVTFAGGATVPGAVLHLDDQLDLAVIEIEPVATEALKASDAAEGDRGFVALVDGDGRTQAVPYVVDRRLVAVTRAVGRDEEVRRRSLQLDTSIESGDSGAVLIDGSGRISGVIWSLSKRDDRRAYATRGDEIQGVLVDATESPTGPTDCRLTTQQ